MRPTLTEPRAFTLILKVARVMGGRCPTTPLTSGGVLVLGLIFKEIPTNSADEAVFFVISPPIVVLLAVVEKDVETKSIFND